jgi:hypothetical protein
MKAVPLQSFGWTTQLTALSFIPTLPQPFVLLTTMSTFHFLFSLATWRILKKNHWTQKGEEQRNSWFGQCGPSTYLKILFFIMKFAISKSFRPNVLSRTYFHIVIAVYLLLVSLVVRFAPDNPLTVVYYVWFAIVANNPRACREVLSSFEC